MVSKDKLCLHQEILLLALRDKEGTIAQGAMYQFAIGGAIIAELLLNKRISIDENKKKLINLIDPSPLHDPLLDECLQKISNAKRRVSIQTWVSKFANTKNIKHRVAEQLCKLGILLADEDQVLLFFTRKIYPEINPEPERKLITRLHEAIFTDSNDIDPSTVVLLSLAKNAGLLKIVFNKKELKAKQDRINSVINGEITGKATKEAIEAMQAAVMVACITPAIVSASVNG